MSAVGLSSKAIKDLCFSIAELTLIESWSKANALRMAVRLDHGSDTEEYEEVLALHIGTSNLCHWILWRDADAVYLQPLIARLRRYRSVAEAFEALAEKSLCSLTDITPACWQA